MGLLLAGVLWLASIAALAGCAATSDSDRVARLAAPRRAGISTPDTQVPIIDAHNHIMPGLEPEALISYLDGAGVKKIILMATGAPPGEQRDALALRVHERFPDRVVPFLGLNGVSRFTKSYLEYLDRQLARGKFRGMGELLSRHYPFETTAQDGSRVRAGDYTLAADSPEALEVMALAAKHNVVLVLHMETTRETVAALERALQKSPRTRVIWAHQTPLKTLDGSGLEHARRADPQQIASLLDKYPNLYADIAVGYETLFLREGDRTLPDAWRNLYERHNGRFVVGMDLPFLGGWRGDAYSRRTLLIRTWLAQLSPETRTKLAHENVERILAGR